MKNSKRNLVGNPLANDVGANALFFLTRLSTILPQITQDTPIPQTPQAMYSFRNADVIGQIRTKKTRFKTSFLS